MRTPNGSPAAPRPEEAVSLLEAVRTFLAAARLPLQLPRAEQMRLDAAGALAQLDDYVLPRYRSLDAPLLAVVGGSTGAGKSTLINALVGHPVTRAGAIRPTTRQPILLHHPADRHWFEDRRVLPSLARVAGLQDQAREAGAGPVDSLVLLEERVIPRGIGLLDAPDIDSISDDNRRLAGQLLSAADLWLFVTTANRYADAVPWKLLLQAAERDILVAVVLDRVPQDVQEEIRADLAAMLERQGLGAARLFVVPELALDARGMLPAASVAAVGDWLAKISADAGGRAAIARRTLNGAVKQLSATAAAVAAAQAEQLAAGVRLGADVRHAYEDATTRVIDSTKDGALLRGEVLARWQDFVGTGEFFRALESGIGRLRDRIGAFFTGKPAPAAEVEEAIESGLHAVIVEEAAKAAEEADQRWRDDPAGRQLLGTDDLAAVGAGFEARAAEQIRAWQGELLELIRSEGRNKRFTARMLSFGINGLGVALMIVVFASTAGLTGLEVGIAGGSAVVGQKLLEAVFGEDAVRRLAKAARYRLHTRCAALMDAEALRFLDRLGSLPAAEDAEQLRRHAQDLVELAAREGAR